MICFLPKVLGQDHPGVILDLIYEFSSLEGPLYPQTLCKGRVMLDSVTLLKSLIEYYKEFKSEVTLNQIIHVLKEDFIERD